MKRLYTIVGVTTKLIAVALLLQASIGSVLLSKVSAFTSGSGTSLDPYIVNDCVELQEIENDLDAHYALGGNIECSDTALWNGWKGFDPIGEDIDPFTGSLDGRDYTINNLYMSWADDEDGESIVDRKYVGLFGYLHTAEVSNVNLTNLKVKGYDYVGGIAGFALNSTVSDIKVNLAVAENDCNPGYCIAASYGQYAGGVVGFASATTIENAETAGPVIGNTSRIGGVVGVAISGSSVINSSSSSNIIGSYGAGGLVGVLDASSIEDSFATGNVAASYLDGFRNGDHTGGLAGVVANASVINSYATGNVTGRGGVGGLIGYFGGNTVNKTYATGDVDADNYAGGLIGFAHDGTITESYSTSNVSTENYNVGGFVGYMNGGTIEDAYARGNVLSETSFAGGFVGTLYTGSIRRSYSTGIVTIPETGSERAGSFSAEAYEDGGDIILEDSFAVGAVNAPAGEGGFIANLNTTGMVFDDNYFDISRTGQENCRAVAGAVTGCHGVNANDSDTNYFIDNVDNAPLNDWNFSSVWKVVQDGYPCLDWQESCSDVTQTLPELLCEQPGRTKTTFTASCTTTPALQVENIWEIQYKKITDTSWIELDSQTGELFDVTVENLDQATRYEVRFRYINNLGTSEWGSQDITTDSDLNGDGILDSSQDNIGGYRSYITGKYVAIDVGENCEITTDDIAEESDLNVKDPNYEYLHGLFDFAGECSEPGFTTNIKLYYYGINTLDFTPRKYNPNTNTYSSLTNTTKQLVTIDGNSVLVLSYNITDGGELDMDGAVNGEFEDPVGLGTLIVGVPNTGIYRQKSL